MYVSCCVVVVMNVDDVWMQRLQVQKSITGHILQSNWGLMSVDQLRGFDKIIDEGFNSLKFHIYNLDDIFLKHYISKLGLIVVITMGLTY
jgi:hypothetical protein